MSDAQILQLLGLIYFAVGLCGVSKRGVFIDIVKDFANSPALIYLGGMVIIVPGYLLVRYHNIWTLDLQLIVTVLGWLMLIKGFMLIAFPEMNKRICMQMAQRKKFFVVWPYIALFVGLLLLVLGIYYDPGFCCGICGGSFN